MWGESTRFVTNPVLRLYGTNLFRNLLILKVGNNVNINSITKLCDHRINYLHTCFNWLDLYILHSASFISLNKSQCKSLDPNKLKPWDVTSSGETSCRCPHHTFCQRNTIYGLLLTSSWTISHFYFYIIIKSLQLLFPDMGKLESL